MRHSESMPMLSAWSRTDQGVRKCRTCMARNFQRLDPAAKRWTAQAEPTGVVLAANLAVMRQWAASKLDVKGRSSTRRCRRTG